jgi:hypothetical protein
MQEERRQQQENTPPTPELLRRGKLQLDTEIRVLETWMLQLNETRKDNPESLAARKAYSDMLQSRRDLLDTLQKHR